MDHTQAQDSFSDYVDGTLPERKRSEVDQHLASCIQCRTELTSFRNTVGSLARAKPAASSATTAARRTSRARRLSRNVIASFYDFEVVRLWLEGTLLVAVLS